MIGLGLQGNIQAFFAKDVEPAHAAASGLGHQQEGVVAENLAAAAGAVIGGWRM